jgi:hypothetical protein
VQGLLSAVHAVPALFLLSSTGQSGPLPGQFSARSHSPAAFRHSVLEDAKPSAGQVVLVPVQFSATSQAPPEARHTVDDDAKSSAGQLVLVPVQFSATSHSAAAARQVTPAFPAGC